MSAVRQVNEEAFGQKDEARLVDALCHYGSSILSLFAIIKDQVVGHILFSPVTIESEKASFRGIGLGPMAVRPAWQSKGIGSELVNAGLEECRNSGHEIVVVLGHPDFYPRFGFAPASKFGIRWEREVPDDVFIVLELRQGALTGRGGIVKYLPKFELV